VVQTVLDEYEDSVTIRHLFYRLVGLGAIDKTEKAYSNLCARLAKWRRSGDVAWDSFVDGTRFYYGSKAFGSLEDALANTAQTYRRNLWSEQKHFVEVWCEKDAIAGMVSSVADAFGVRTFICRGFPSLTSIHTAARTYAAAQNRGKEVTILYLGDHDPSGRAIDEAIQDALADDFGVEIGFERLAIQPEQIRKWNLPTRPVKKTDTRATGWDGGCVEIDTLKPDQLTQLVEGAITIRIQFHQWKMAQEIEEQERETLKTIAGNWHSGGQPKPGSP